MNNGVKGVFFHESSFEISPLFPQRNRVLYRNRSSNFILHSIHNYLSTVFDQGSLDVRSTNRIGNCENCDTNGPRQENPLSEGRAIMKIKSPGITKSASPISKDFPVFHARLFDRLLFIVNKYATKKLFIPLERR